jgi:hypothetical protein
LTISIEVESGEELIDDFLLPVILEAHHLGQLKLITSLLDGIEVLVPLGCHPFPIDPLGLHHRLPLQDLHWPIPIGVEEGPKCQSMHILQLE